MSKTNYLVVLPSIYPPWTEACLSTCRLDNVIVIDNSKDNRGFPKSVNEGIYALEASDTAQWLVILSAAIRFGEPGGLDFIEALQDRPDHVAVEAMPVFGWHLIAFHRDTIKAVGRWDENFVPYGYDDLDYSWRIQQAFALKAPLWEKVKVDVQDMGMGHSIHLAGVRGDPQKLEQYYLSKWGGLTGSEQYSRPFNDLGNDIGYWPAYGGG